jgi:hypothetical protein
MNEVPCYKTVRESEIIYLPVTTVLELKELYDIINKVQCLPELSGNTEQEALKVLRVFAYNLVHSVVQSA